MTEILASRENRLHTDRLRLGSISGRGFEISGRRAFLKAALLAGLGFPMVGQALADEFAGGQ
jgi:hypothetical protein